MADRGPTLELREQVVVVTGANGAMGAALVKHLQGRARHVVGSLRGASVDWRPMDDTLSYVTGNLTDRTAVNFVVAEILRHQETCHAWVNVAGGFALDGRVEAVSPEAWPRMFDLNFITCLNACQAVLPVFKEQGFGRIINFGSAAGDTGLAQAGPYAVSKAAVHNLTQTIAREGGGKVTANLIVPTTIDTPANRQAMPNADFASWTLPVVIAEKVAEILNETVNPPNGERFIF